jgi:putative ABC transport system permease protein
VNAKLELAWANITHNRTRTAAGVAGVAFAILLLFMQLGFYDTSYRSSTMLLDQFDFEVALRSPQYGYLRAAGTIPRRRLYQAAAVPGVRVALPLYVGNGVYQQPISRLRREIVVLGVDPRTEPFSEPVLAANVGRLAVDDTAIMDTATRADYDQVLQGQMPSVENRRLQILETYRYGTGFIGDASIVVSDQTYARLFPGLPLSDVNMGLVQLEPGADRDRVIEGLRAVMPGDVEVLTRREVEAVEQNLFVRIRPIGVMFTSGVVLAFIVGAVIVYQILSTEIMNRLKEYATLKAMGHDDRFVRGVVLRQAVLYAGIAAVPGTIGAFILYEVLSRMTNLPMVMTPARLIAVGVLAVGMSIGAALLAIRRVSRANPADLF